MELNMIPTFKQFFQDETVNYEKSYYERYDAKNESLTQAGNDETENIRDNTYEAECYG